MKRIFKKLKRMIKSFFGLFLIIPNACKTANEETYFPEGKRKPKRVRVADNIKWQIKYKEINQFYMLYGMDTYDCALSNIIDYLSFMNSRSDKNACHGKTYNYNAILRDKLIFYRYMTSVGLKTPKIFAIYSKGQLFDINSNKIDYSDIQDHKDFFVKSLDGECASFVVHVSDVEEFQKVMSDKNKDMYILQERLFQNDKMSEINPTSVNTIRMVTVREHGEIKMFSSVLRVGTSKTDNVDNWSYGGLSIGINPDGTLQKYGFYKPPFGTKTDTHPDSKVVFSDFTIPDFNSIVDVACRAHQTLYGLHSIGWDIVLTDKGVSFIEGNDNWEISLMQACNGGLKKEWLECCK